MQKTGRNDPCPCGSGKKYKKCHELQKTKRFEVMSSATPEHASRRTDKVSTLFFKSTPTESTPKPIKLSAGI
jgi:hypothetical protein